MMMRKIFNLFIFLLFSLCASTSWGQTAPVPPPPPSCATSDRQVLIDFYNAMGGVGWHLPSSTTPIPINQQWVTTNLNPISTWYGVRTNAAGCVTGIDLDGGIDFGYLSYTSSPTGIGVKGSIPLSFGTLSNLTFLSLKNNDLRTNSSSLYPFPPAITQLTNLTDLLLDNCHITGNIPTAINDLIRLS